MSLARDRPGVAGNLLPADRLAFCEAIQAERLDSSARSTFGNQLSDNTAGYRTEQYALFPVAAGYVDPAPAWNFSDYGQAVGG